MKLTKQLSILEAAAELGRLAHKDQKRKYTDEPYFVHPARVAKLYAAMYPSRNPPFFGVAACYLHDVLEDTDITEWQLRQAFVVEPRVADLVVELTDQSRPEDGNRRVRKKKDRERLWAASREAQIIKCCDMIDNSISIVDHDRDFAKTYMAEKEALLAGFTKVFNTAAWSLASQIVRWYNDDPDSVARNWRPHEKEFFNKGKR